MVHQAQKLKGLPDGRRVYFHVADELVDQVGIMYHLSADEMRSHVFWIKPGELRKLAAGKLVLSLEGGYHLPSISDCTEICVRSLLGEQVGSGSRAVPRVCFAPAVRVHIHIHIVC